MRRTKLSTFLKKKNLIAEVLHNSESDKNCKFHTLSNKIPEKEWLVMIGSCDYLNPIMVSRENLIVQVKLPAFGSGKQDQFYQNTRF
jgi:hypothetical protein